MKYKIYAPIVVLIYSREGSKTPTASTQSFDPCKTYGEASQKANLHLNYHRENIEVDGQKVEGWKGQVVNGYATVNEFVIDTDDFDEYKPSYEVEITVTQTRSFSVEIDAETIEQYGNDLDEYGAAVTAEEMFNDGEFEDEFDNAYIESTDAECDAQEQ